MKRIFSILLIILLLSTSLSLFGCKSYEYSYGGEYPDLYTVAINSVIGSVGYHPGERIFDPEIAILETDSKGRTLFVYNELTSIFGDSSLVALCIVQKSDTNWAYYYEDYNYIFANTINEFEVNKESQFIYYEYVDIPGVWIKVDKEKMENLKKQNDWEKEINLNKCVSKQLMTNKKEPTIEENGLDKIYQNAFKLKNEEVPSLNSYCTYCYKDNYDKHLYLMEHYNVDVQESPYRVVLIENKEYIDSIEISGYDFQEKVKRFKEQNGWNNP